jgi:hypothetical protein
MNIHFDERAEVNALTFICCLIYQKAARGGCYGGYISPLLSKAVVCNPRAKKMGIEDMITL